MISNVEEPSLTKSIQFGLFSPKDIVDYSVCEIKLPILYSGGRPARDGLMDPRLGTISREYTCETCQQTCNECPGHFGHIELAEPLFHLGYIDVIYKILQCTCPNCGRLKVDYNDPEFQSIIKRYHGKQRLLAIHEKCNSVNKCEHRKTGSSKQAAQKEESTEKAESSDLETSEQDIVKDPSFWKALGSDLLGIDITDPEILEQDIRKKPPCTHDIVEITKDEEGHFRKKEHAIGSNDSVSAAQVLELFKNICEADILALGLNTRYSRPEWMILTFLPVPPPHVRPPVRAEGANPSADDVTHKLASILQTNTYLKKLKDDGAQQVAQSECINHLQWHIDTYIINDKPQIKRATVSNQKPIKSISQRLKGKEGHIRGNLSGKRDDFSSRSVISPDPSIRIDQVGVPQEVAKILTFPEVVTERNRDYLKKLVEAGPDELKGANYVILPNKMKISLAINKLDFDLDDLCVVERHITDGDIVIFNRQPSLHKMSMMGHHALILPGMTFRLNLSVTTPYNADFDGDEMNLHVPQTQTARAEVKHIMLVPNQIISPQGNKPIIGLVQDSLIGAQILSYKSTFLNRNEVMNLMMWVRSRPNITLPPPCIMVPQKGIYLWSGKQVFSIFMPSINYDSGGSDGWMPGNDQRVIIREGQLLTGILNSKTVARSEKSLPHIIINSYSKNLARDFLSETQMVVNNWLESRGFSVGLIDAVLPPRTLETVHQELDKLESNVKDVIHQAESNKLEIKPGMTLVESFEATVNNESNDIINVCGKQLLGATRFWNSFSQMVKAGSKGSTINLSQIMAVVGQQNIEGKRIKYGMTKRTLPHYLKDDLELEPKGFCRHSFLKGLNPQEFFFHAMSGREGIIDTACKTSDTGYIQRRLCKSMESHCVQYDGTVRNSLNDVIQFLYGGDGLDPTGLETVNINLINYGTQQFEDIYVLDLNTAYFGIGYMEQEVIDETKSSPTAQSVLDREINRLHEFQKTLREDIFLTPEAKCCLPINIPRLIESSQVLNHINPFSDRSDLNPETVVKLVEQVVDTITQTIVLGQDELSREAQLNATLLLRIYIFSLLASKPVIYKHRLTKAALKWILEEIETRFNQTIISPGEMVGTIGGQSIGEPTTQMTLNTFHFAGVSAKNVTLGVPRMNEIMNLAKVMKTPSCTVFLDKEIRNDEERAKDITAQLEHASLKKLVLKSEIFYDPSDAETKIEEDDWAEFADNPYKSVDCSPWILRFVLDNDVLIDKNITLTEIAKAINTKYQNQFFAITNEGRSGSPIIRVRAVNRQKFDDKDGRIMQIVEQDFYQSLSLKGIQGITRVAMESLKHYIVDPNTNRYAISGGDGNCIENEWVLYTEGSSLRNILNHPMVDPIRTFTNDIIETNSVLGIEASRNALIHEFKRVFQGSSINPHHIELLADTMCHFGELRPLTRFGIGKLSTGVLMKASFEQTVEILFDSAAFAERDEMIDVSSNILVGNTTKVGTGLVETLIDPTMLPKKNVVTQDGSGQMLIDLPSPISQVSPGAISQTIAAPVDVDDFNASPIVASPQYDNDDDSVPEYLRSTNYYDHSYTAITPSPQNEMSPILNSPYYETMSYNPASPVSPYPDIMNPHEPSSPMSPSYNQNSPSYSPTSPSYSPTSPSYSPTSPQYSQTSPSYSPTSPSYSPTSPSYSPTSPSYSPTSPSYSPTSPSYSPTSPSYSPTSPSYSPTSPSYSPTSPSYSPTSPSYSPTSPAYSPTSPSYSPTAQSPAYSPSSPSYSPTNQSPSYSTSHQK